MTLYSAMGEIIYIVFFGLLIFWGIPLMWEIFCCAGNFAADVLSCFIERIKDLWKPKT